MFADRLNADCIWKLISSEGVGRLGDLVQSLVDALRDVRLDECEALIRKCLALRARRYGKGGELLGPFGYFHPSEILDVIADNADRGRLSQNSSKSLYTYDFYPNGEVAVISFPRCAAKTFCEPIGSTKAYLTYEMHRDGSHEIVDITLAKYADTGLLEAMVQTSLFDNASSVGHINIEMYDSLEAGERTCRTLLLIPADDSCRIHGIYVCFKSAYRVTYDDKMKILDCECLLSNEMSRITL